MPELCDEIEVIGVIERLRASAQKTSEATRFLSEAKAERNRSAGETDAHYDWLRPEQTLEWRAADILQKLWDSNLRVALRLIIGHWDEFGPADGFDEVIDRARTIAKIS